MRIGLDLDDTIANTSLLVSELLEEFSRKNNIDLNVLNSNGKIIDEFFMEYATTLFRDSSVKDNCSKVIKNLKNKGHKIYVITARSNYYLKDNEDVREITKRWLEENDIEVDGLITNVYGEKKREICNNYKIDLMIDDDFNNYQIIKKSNTKCLLYDELKRYDFEDVVENWLEIEEKIEKGI